MSYPSRGFTLLELLVVLCIIFISASLSVSAISLVSKHRAEAIVADLVHLLAAARQTAVSKKVVTTICPSNDGVRCEKNWSYEIIAFEDRNNNKIRENNEPIISNKSALPSTHQLTWRSFQNKPYIQYSSVGYTLSHNGSFVLCDKSSVRVLIMNKMGRVRHGQDRDGDGNQEMANGKVAVCK
ncbi:MAG: GspH/FimT family pseudopilin [Pseudomonadales bacterium]|nr:GspH/FimT family pseudopilin [Pseudomonadales bacterium]